MTTGPALVSILRQGSYLIASIHTALDDSQMVRFQEDLVEQIGRHRSRGVIIDVAALDVLDSFGARTLRTIAEMARLRGALTVIVGIQPDVAFAMVAWAWAPAPLITALDLEEGLAYLDQPHPAAVGRAGRRARRAAMTGLEDLTRDYRAAFLQLPAPPRGGRTARGLRARPDGGHRGRQHARAGPDPPRDPARGPARDGARPRSAEVATAASEFFLEVLATFDMAQRSFLDQR